MIFQEAYTQYTHHDKDNLVTYPKIHEIYSDTGHLAT